MATFLCAPALLFLILVIIEILFELYLGIREEIMVYLIAIIILLIYTLGLNYLCTKGYRAIAWTIVLLPHVLQFSGILFFGDSCKFLPSSLCFDTQELK
jgi:hypothetical protein